MALCFPAGRPLVSVLFHRYLNSRNNSFLFVFDPGFPQLPPHSPRQRS
ncbi:hypothetical protein EVA_15059 [gut metagenome]|uniref:Uncharacterized protein n=1 Tax=gut metagenome TaxID=749906 RepID=J9GBP0_9ZZZZ